VLRKEEGQGWKPLHHLQAGDVPYPLLFEGNKETLSKPMDTR
jgi:hypothetical protein